MHSGWICLEWGRSCACYLLPAPCIKMFDFLVWNIYFVLYFSKYKDVRCWLFIEFWYCTYLHILHAFSRVFNIDRCWSGFCSFNVFVVQLFLIMVSVERKWKLLTSRRCWSEMAALISYFFPFLQTDISHTILFLIICLMKRY